MKTKRVLSTSIEGTRFHKNKSHRFLGETEDTVRENHLISPSWGVGTRERKRERGGD